MSVDVSPAKSFCLWATTRVSDWRNGFVDKQVNAQDKITYRYREDMSYGDVILRRIVAQSAFIALSVVALVETAVRATLGLISLGVHHSLPAGGSKEWVRQKVIAYTLDMSLTCALAVFTNVFYSLINPIATHMQYTHDEDLSCCWSPNAGYSLVYLSVISSVVKIRQEIDI